METERGNRETEREKGGTERGRRKIEREETGTGIEKTGNSGQRDIQRMGGLEDDFLFHLSTGSLLSSTITHTMTQRRQVRTCQLTWVNTPQTSGHGRRRTTHRRTHTRARTHARTQTPHDGRGHGRPPLDAPLETINELNEGGGGGQMSVCECVCGDADKSDSVNGNEFRGGYEVDLTEERKKAEMKFMWRNRFAIMYIKSTSNRRKC